MKMLTRFALFLLLSFGLPVRAEIPSEGLIEHAEIVAVKCSAGDHPGILTIRTSEKARSGLYKKASLPIDINVCIYLQAKVRNSLGCRGIAWADLYMRNAVVVGAERIMESEGLCGGYRLD